MDVNSSDQNGKPTINLSAEEIKEKSSPKAPSKGTELPVILHPKFGKRRRRRRLNMKTSASKESASKDEGEGDEKPTEERDTKEEVDRPSAERVDTEEGKVPRERETEEPECRESEIRIVIESPSVDEDQEAKSERRRRKKTQSTVNSLDENEVKLVKKGTSKRKRSGQKKRNSGRNSGRKTQASEERKNRKKQKTPRKDTPSPKQSSTVAIKLEKSLENLASKRGKKTPSTPDKKTSLAAQDPPKPPKKKTFFRTILDKTKFWMRKSDDVAQPTKEMLFKSYVLPEYDNSNSTDFQPDPHQYFCDEDWKLRLRNARCDRDDVFVNSRPFWIQRSQEDVIPKCKLLAHSGLVTQYAANNSCFMKELPRRSFLDPKKDSLDKLMAVDKTIGVDNGDPTRKEELKRVISNTFHGTCTMQSYRKTAEGKKKMEEWETRIGVRDTSSADRGSKEKAGPKVTFPDKPMQLNLYTRKDRPQPGETRKFRNIEYSGFEPTKKLSKLRQQSAVFPVYPEPGAEKKKT